MELEYYDCDEDGNPIGSGNQPAWRNLRNVAKWALLKRIFDITGKRTNFKSKWERTRWNLICRKIDKGQIPMEWVEDKIDWAKTENKGKYVVSITFPAVMSAILNVNAMKDWMARNKMPSITSTAPEGTTAEQPKGGEASYGK